MNFIGKFDEWEINPSKLTEKKQQTNKKIEYVRDYIIRWSAISAARSDVHTITFIDCMSNAGVYRDGDCCTAVEILKVFNDAAKKYPGKTFRVLCNDISPEKIEILKKVAPVVLTKTKNSHMSFAFQIMWNYTVSYLRPPASEALRFSKNLFGLYLTVQNITEITQTVINCLSFQVPI